MQRPPNRRLTAIVLTRQLCHCLAGSVTLGDAPALAVIECKRPDLKEPIEQAISQHLRNQRDDEIPKLFLYSQLLLAISKNDAKFGTTGTPAKFWSVWKEDVDVTLARIVNKPLTWENVRWWPVRAQPEQIPVGLNTVSGSPRV